MAECIVGDIAPSDNISKAEKHRREDVRANTAVCLKHDMMTRMVVFCLFQEAMKHLSDLLPEGLKQEIYGLWEVFCISAVLWDDS